MAAQSNTPIHIYSWILDVIKSSKTTNHLDSSVRLVKLFKSRFPEHASYYNTLIYYADLKRQHQ